MSRYVKLYEYPVKDVLRELLEDKSTKQNIIFATDVYTTIDPRITAKSQMTYDLLKTFGESAIQPRVCKTRNEQSARTKAKAEVFTPSWICNKMNNHCDAEWFGRENVFNRENGNGWITNTDMIQFDEKKTWKDYVDSRRLEITCGEAPYLVSRYDASTGESIMIADRIGLLDRKLRVVNENTTTEKEWFEWVYRAFQSVYGYEFQGDNLLIARINLLNTFVDYVQDRWHRNPAVAELVKITNIICWNLWQMDGITGTIPFRRPKEDFQQVSLFDYIVMEDGVEEKKNEKNEPDIDCKIFDWRKRTSISYRKLKESK